MESGMESDLIKKRRLMENGEVLFHSFVEHQEYNLNSDVEKIPANLFVIIRNREKSESVKLVEIKKLFRMKPKPCVSDQDENDILNTPLHMAVSRGYLEIVKFLLQNGGDNNLINMEGDTALRLAIRLNHNSIVNAIAQHRKQSVLKQKAQNQTNYFEPDSNNQPFPSKFCKGKAKANGDCFFDSMAQAMNRLDLGKSFDVRSLRQDCFNFARDNMETVYDKRTGEIWREVITKDAFYGGYESHGRDETSNFNSYLVHIQLIAEETQNLQLGPVIWGRPEIEGRLLCLKYGIKLHVIEKHLVDEEEVIIHSLEDGFKSIQLEDDKIYEEARVVHIFNEGHFHFVPVLSYEPKSSVKKVRSKEITQPPPIEFDSELSFDFPVQGHRNKASRYLAEHL